MASTSQNSNWVVASILVLAVAVTRSGHFGSAITLPDATLAAFFLSGAFGASAWIVPVLMLAAATVDYVAITTQDVDRHVLTPAYLFMIPTYAALWFAGRWYVRRAQGDRHAIIPLAIAVLVGASAAFLISNGSYFALSGYFGSLSAMMYATAVAQYFPHYMGWTVFYVAVGMALARATKRFAPAPALPKA
jgi:hypothetical protein